MAFLGIRNERKIVDGLVVMVAASSAYFGGFLQTIGLGPVSAPMLLPVVFLLALCFMHLVLRKSRKFDEHEHSPGYVILKTFIFTGMTVFSYRAGLSTMANLAPSDTISAALTVFLMLLNLYVMAYRANLNR